MKAIATLLLLAAALLPALAQNRPGMQPEGTIVLGNCMKFGTSQSKAADAGGPCQLTNQPAALTIGAKVTGAQVGRCLTVNAQGNLDQTDCLIAN